MTNTKPTTYQINKALIRLSKDRSLCAGSDVLSIGLLDAEGETNLVMILSGSGGIYTIALYQKVITNLDYISAEVISGYLYLQTEKTNDLKRQIAEIESGIVDSRSIIPEQLSNILDGLS